jgi:hypothetical protein
MTALVAIGGRASRLRGAVPVPVTKSFLPLAGRPLLEWCLTALHDAGIRHLVLAGDGDAQLHHARALLAHLSSFDRVDYYLDGGLGVHGLPWHTRPLLGDGPVLFEAGHAVTPPGHYRALLDAHRPGHLVVSGFLPADNLSRPLRSGRAIAQPIAFDRPYTRLIADQRFAFPAAMAVHARAGTLRVLDAPCQPEFDLPAEYQACMATWRRNLTRNPEQPWRAA